LGSANIAYFNRLGILRSANTLNGSDEINPMRNSVFTSSEGNSLDTLIKFVKANDLAKFNNEAHRLLTKKMNLNIPTTGGWTCLHYAAYMGHTQIADALLKT